MAKIKQRHRGFSDYFFDYLKVFGLFFVVRVVMLDARLALLNIPFLDPTIYKLLAYFKEFFK